MTACIFCQIVNGTAEASEVYRDECVVAFLDTRPINPGHVLVVPVNHAAGLAALDEEDGAQMFRVGRRLAAALRASGLPCEAVNLLLSDGEAAGQEVFHAHLHVVPRFRGDGFGFRFGANRAAGRPAREELDLAAEMIREGLVGKN